MSKSILTRKGKHDKVGLRGFFRLQIVNKKTGHVDGECEGYNQITLYGLESCLVANPVNGIANANKMISMILGSGTGIESNSTALNGSNTDQRSAFGGQSVISTTTARMTQSFDGNNSSMATLRDIGVIDSDSKCVAGKSFASSQLDTDQTVNATYEIQYATS